MISNNDDFNGKWNDISNNNLILKYYNNGNPDSSKDLNEDF